MREIRPVLPRATALASLGLVLLFAACTTAGSGKRKDASGGSDGSDGSDGTDNPCSNGTQDGDETDVDCGGACGPCAEGKSCAANGDCSSGQCGVTYTCVSAQCANNEQDLDETGIDCGGSCLLCPGDKCSANDQCTTGFCKTGVCDTPSCTDGLKNGAETGVDCGGECPLCGDGQGCVSDASCTSGFCNAAKKCAAPSCTDTEKNADETDVDCGGSCGACADGKACSSKADCTSGKCESGKCQALGGTCTNGTKDGDETDVDCGGSCNGCGSNAACGDGDDCASGICQAGKCTLPASCTDAVLSPGETDVDCGGTTCDACGLTKACKVHDDCLSVACILGQCKEPACDDGVMNGKETDQDCGAGCPACGDGKMCAAGADCEGGNCTGGFCGSCSDNKKNGAETDVDCGGPCEPCATGKACDQDFDCTSGDCSGGVCVSCNDKVKNGTESDVDCGGACDPCAVGKTCTVNNDCAQETCGTDNTCCVPNACGTCGAVPTEICNGVDDDCDGQTDEALTVQDCSNQKGVCAGSKATCQGTKSWVCDDATYAAHSAEWAKEESTCDKLDNDCDGQTDEGDCAACSAKVVVNDAFNNGEFSDFQLGWEWLALKGGVPYAAISAYQSGFSFSRSAFIVWPESYSSVETKVVNGPGLASDGPTLYMAARQDLSAFNPYVLAGPIQSGLNDWISYSADVPAGEHSTPIAVSASGMAFSYVLAPNNVYKMMGAMTESLTAFAGASPFVLDPSGFDSAVAVAITSDVAHFVFRTNFGNGELIHQTSAVDFETIAPSAGPPDVAAHTDGSLYVAYKNSPSGTSVMLSHMSPEGDWDDAIEVAKSVTKQYVAVSVDPEGRPIVAWVEAAAKVHLARVEDGKVVDMGAKTMDASKADGIAGLEIIAVANGVVHVAVWFDYLDKAQFEFTTTCKGFGDAAACVPACAGKVCGNDGCGGTCGTCTGGKTCNASGQCVGSCTPNCTNKACGDNGCGGSCGTCTAGKTCSGAGKCEAAAACGGNPSSTCNGACGNQAASGCYCDEACTQNGDCCDDYQGCCLASCTPSCTGKTCGSDGCGGSCGTCGASQVCNASGKCETAPALPFGVPAGCISADLTIDCNPLTVQGCNTASGETCDISNTGTTCYPAPNDAPANAACSNDTGPFCIPKYRCGSTGTCKKFCCSNSDCGGQTCTSVLGANGTLGTCP